MPDIASLTAHIRAFRDERDWEQFHNPKDLAISLVLEAGEVLEHSQWCSPEEVADRATTHRDALAHELADVAIYLFGLADQLDVDLAAAITDKLAINAERYPVDRARGTHAKYTDL